MFNENIMEQKTRYIILVLIFIILFSGCFLFVQNLIKERVLSQIIYKTLERWHYTEKKIDDEFSKNAYNKFLKYLDFNKRFFLQSDIKEFKKYMYKLDDELRTGKNEFMKAAIQCMKKRVSQVMGFYESMLVTHFDFTKKEYIELNADKRAYCSDLKELKEYWRKILKQQALIRYINLLNAKVSKNPKKKLREEAQKSVLKSFKSVFSRMLKLSTDDILFGYLNSIIKVYDPHTVYFSPKQKKDFDIKMSGRLEGIGALLSEEDGFVKVVRIIPGGPSWFQKQLGPADLILKVGQGSEEPIDIIGMPLRDAVELIRGKKGSIVRLTVKKPDGRTLIISIERDVVLIDETFAKSAIFINEKLNKTFGYLLLPGFYNDFSNKDGRNSSEDIKKEIQKLKLKKVDGIVLDLRNNGGGSLEDAIRITGLFIEHGPILQIKGRENQIQVVNDPDPEISYKGPLVVLINSLSASASEILAGALQDYERAIVVGGAHSFGKGSVQIMIPLDKMAPDSSFDVSKLGALEFTIRKFYRITGISNQYKGVIPDIILPDFYDYLEIGERYLDYALKWDRIANVSYKKWDKNGIDIKIIAEKSKFRVKNSKYFKHMENYIKGLKSIRNKTMQNLKLENVLKQNRKLKQKSDKIKVSGMELLNFKITSSQKTGINSSKLSKISDQKEKDWFKLLKKDLFLEETLNVLNDMIDMQRAN
jgi:carboxyl-terminal processing protease